MAKIATCPRCKHDMTERKGDFWICNLHNSKFPIYKEKNKIRSSDKKKLIQDGKLEGQTKDTVHTCIEKGKEYSFSEGVKHIVGAFETVVSDVFNNEYKGYLTYKNSLITGKNSEGDAIIQKSAQYILDQQKIIDQRKKSGAGVKDPVIMIAENNIKVREKADVAKLAIINTSGKAEVSEAQKAFGDFESYLSTEYSFWYEKILIYWKAFRKTRREYDPKAGDLFLPDREKLKLECNVKKLADYHTITIYCEKGITDINNKIAEIKK